MFNSFCVDEKSPSTFSTLAGSLFVSSQSSDVGLRSIRPMKVKTLNGLTFSDLEAYGCLTISTSVYGNMQMFAGVVVTLVDFVVLIFRGTLLVK